MAAWARRQPARTWLGLAAVTIAVSLSGWMLIFWQAQPSLQFRYSSAWWNLDSAPVVQTEAAGVTQYTVPLRPGKIQGFADLGLQPV